MINKQNWDASNPSHLIHKLHLYPLHHRGLAAKTSNFKIYIYLSRISLQ